MPRWAIVTAIDCFSCLDAALAKALTRAALIRGSGRWRSIGCSVDSSIGRRDERLASNSSRRSLATARVHVSAAAPRWNRNARLTGVLAIVTWIYRPRRSEKHVFVLARRFSPAQSGQLLEPGVFRLLNSSALPPLPLIAGLP